MYSKACLFRPSVTLAYHDIGQSDIRYGLTTNIPLQAMPYMREKLNSGPKDMCTKHINFYCIFEQIGFPANGCKYSFWLILY